MRAIHIILGLALALLLVAAFVAYAWRPAITPVAASPSSSFDAGSVAKGAELALIGNCNVCHTAEGGASYAGGRPLKTPYGTIYSTNITPEPATGIGQWSEAAFLRAMREGVARDGRHLYPAFPYDHFARMSDEDIHAIYAYIMTRPPVRAEPPSNELRFPFNIRMLLAGWKALYHRPGAFQPDSAQSAEWNRGAYLVQGAGHCSACHTPRNVLGAEERRRYLAGGEAEGWHAPALNTASPAPAPWNVETLYQYLRQGIAEKHAVAAGPMLPVIQNLAIVSQQDVRAMAVYIASYAAQVTPERQQRAEYSAARAQNDAAAQTTGEAAQRMDGGDQALQMGRAIYLDACAVCHEGGRQTSSSATALNLALASGLTLPTPSNLMHIILDGIEPPEGERGRRMPPFTGALTDEQVVALVRFLRADIAKGTPWRDVEGELRKVQRDRERRLALAG
jgi:mono/diheme cytochrome c family protein